MEQAYEGATAGSLAAPQSQPAVVKVGGEILGTAQPTETLSQVLRKFAESRGIKSFAVLVDGQRLTTRDASNQVAGIHEIEIIPKDARGRQ